MLFTYSRQRTVPAVAAHVRDVALKAQGINTSNIFALKASSANTVVIESDAIELDTGYLFTDIFTADESGSYETIITTSEFFDYRVFEPTTQVVQQLENHSNLDQRGLFDTAYDHESFLDLDTQLRVRDSAGDQITVGQELILKSPDGSRWTVTVENDGEIEATKL